MRALFDVNVLIALFDPTQIYPPPHGSLWIEAHRKLGWATSPITQNGCVRILAQPKYPNSIPSTDAIHVLRNYSDTAIIGALSPAEWSRSGMGLQKLAILLGHSDIKIHDAVRTHGAAERRHRGS